MAQTVGQGGTITLDAFFRDGTNQLVDPVNPQVSIVNPSGTTVVLLDTPTHIALGHYQFSYPVDIGAPLGAWAALWYGVINGDAVTDEDGFTVVEGGSIGFGPSDGLTCEPWATEADLCSPCDDYETLSPLAAEMLQAATDIVFELSGGQYPGECGRTIRPCARRIGGFREYDAAPPGWSRGWGVCGCSTDRCSCGCLHQVELGAYPIVEVTEVRVDGDLVDPSLYRVDDWRYLVRLNDPDGSNPGWPRCQDLTAASTEENTFEVSFYWGRRPPALGVTAVAVLACELAMSCQPELQDKCRLPKTATSVTRDGITVVMSPSDFLDKDGKTGLYELDLFIRAVNPDRHRRAGTVWTPNSAPMARRTDT